MFTVAVRLEYTTGEGPAWLGFTINSPGSSAEDACTVQAGKFNASLSQGLALTLHDGELVRVVPAHSVLVVSVRPARAEDLRA